MVGDIRNIWASADGRFDTQDSVYDVAWNESHE
jgi:hypothetical protein